MTRFRRYLNLYERYAAALFLIIALVLPRASAVLIEFIPGVDTVVICTGSEFVTLKLGPDGKPIEAEESGDNRCTLSEVAVVDLSSQANWQRLASDYKRVFSVAENQQFSALRLTLQKPSRAPPALI